MSLLPDSLQAQLISMDLIPTLVKLLGLHSHNAALTEMCLIAFGNLAELGEEQGPGPGSSWAASDSSALSRV